MKIPEGFSTYILYSPSRDRYYIGQSKNLAARLAQHLEGSTPSTSSTRDWELHFFELFETRAEAMRFEALIKKKKSRASIQRFIQHPSNLCRDPIKLDALTP